MQLYKIKVVNPKSTNKELYLYEDNGHLIFSPKEYLSKFYELVKENELNSIAVINRHKKSTQAKGLTYKMIPVKD